MKQFKKLNSGKINKTAAKKLHNTPPRETNKKWYSMAKCKANIGNTIKSKLAGYFKNVCLCFLFASSESLRGNLFFYYFYYFRLFRWFCFNFILFGRASLWYIWPTLLKITQTNDHVEDAKRQSGDAIILEGQKRKKGGGVERLLK